MVLSLASIKNASSMNSVNSRSGSKSEAIAAFALEPMPKGAFPAIACARSLLLSSDQRDSSEVMRGRQD